MATTLTDWWICRITVVALCCVVCCVLCVCVCVLVLVRMVDLLAEFDLYHGLFQHIRCVEFEGRKYFTRICEYSISQRSELLEPYIESRPLFLEQLVASYEEKDVSVALCGDAILRACLMRESICETWFNHKPSLVQPFFKYVELPNFDISAHAFETLKVAKHTRNKHRTVAAGWVTEQSRASRAYRSCVVTPS